MAFEKKIGSCGFFKNTKNDRSDLTGDIILACPHCGSTYAAWVDGWHRVSQGGLKYINLTIKPKRKKDPVADDDEQAPRTDQGSNR